MSLGTRLLTTWRHLIGLGAGGLVAWTRDRRAAGRAGLAVTLARPLAAAVRPFVDRTLAGEPFPVQFRRRLERLGTTYVKLGQILSLRADLLPLSVTEELGNLFDRLPPVPFDELRRRIAADLGRPVEEAFAWIDETPLGSASIAQTHRARTGDGEDVILKVVKPGIPELLRRDAVLLRGVGRALQLVLSRYQPRRVIDEFCEYTLREVDLVREADNAEAFAANFRDQPDIVFPRIWRELSGPHVLCMEFLDGIKPSDPRTAELTAEQRERLVDLGATAIIRMLYRDGFFHADLHPGNLLILPGARCGFIDLGMVGRFDEELRRTLMYYYYSLVIGDAANAARFLAAVADPGPGADPHGFRKEVEEISRRWSRHANFKEFSLARLVLESVARAGHYRMFFPVEMVLMVKALITFEGVGQMLRPGLDVAAVSRRHVTRIFLAQFNPLRLGRETLRSAPELIDAIAKAPMLITEGLRVLERATRRPPDNPLAGLRGTLIAGSCLVAGAILATFGGPWPIWVALFGVAIVLALRRGG